MTHGGTPDTDLIKLDHILPLWQSVLLWIPNLTLIGIDLPSLFHWSSQDGFQFMTSLPHESCNGNIWIGCTVWVRQAWSVGSEIWFYLLSPLIVFGSFRRIFGFAIASLSIAIFCTFYLHRPIYFFWPAQIIYFIAGIFLFKLYEKTNLLKYLPKGSLARNLMIFSPLLWIVILPTSGHSLPEYILFPIAACSIPILFFLTKNNSIDREIGNLSYCTYLNHLLVISMVAVIVKRLHLATQLSIPMILVGSLVLAFILERIVDRPIERFREAFAKRKLKSASSIS
jgi:peptidoglycan/LPS O-acetylase OafA/YrhL